VFIAFAPSGVHSFIRIADASAKTFIANDSLQDACQKTIAIANRLKRRFFYINL